MPESRNDTNFLRVLAILLVINSHLRFLAPRLAVIATGGMIGNALFFMLSAWGLLLSMQNKPRSFGDWYGRRIIRIYPAVWVTVLLLSLPLGIYAGTIRLDNVLEATNKFFYPPFWFLQALMVYYAIIFFIISRFSYRLLLLVTLPVLTLYALYYIFLLDRTVWSIEQTPFRLIFYFLVMLWGLYLGSKSATLRFQGVRDVGLMFACLIVIYADKFLMGRGLWPSSQFIQHLITFPLLYSLAKIAKSSFITNKLMASRYLGSALSFLSTITLEVFMVNNSLDPIDSKLGPFPFNIIALLAINLGLAFLIFSLAKPVRRLLESRRPQLSAPATVKEMAVGRSS